MWGSNPFETTKFMSLYDLLVSLQPLELMLVSKTLGIFSPILVGKALEEMKMVNTSAVYNNCMVEYVKKIKNKNVVLKKLFS